MIDAAWLAEMREGPLDGLVAAKKYLQLAAVAEKWEDTDIAIECECARAVMLNEYADDSKGALASLKEAEKKHPNNPRLLRERAKIYFSNGDHKTALATIEKVVDAIPKDDHIERAFALKDAAVSAAKTAKTGHLQKAGYYFTEAYKAAISAGESMRPMAIGLKADCALVKFQSGEAGDAIQLVREAILETEQLKPEVGKKAKFCRLCLYQVILWMQAQVWKSAPVQCDFTVLVGCCSNADPPDKGHLG
jgi:tetratricopeptide (TPR) repeat protein